MLLLYCAKLSQDLGRPALLVWQVAAHSHLFLVKDGDRGDFVLEVRMVLGVRVLLLKVNVRMEL